MNVEVIKGTKTKVVKQDRKLRVAAYVRVSSELDHSLLSFNNQLSYYQMKINNNPNWNYAGIYSDEGISGTKIKNRKGFLRMLVEAENGNIDLILTKSISRFARNTLDTIKYIRFLKELNVGVYFEEEHINTLEMKNELIISILSSIAQQEVINLTANINYGMQERMRQGNAIGFTGCLGYDKDLNVIPEEAKIVKLIFKLYLEGKGTVIIKDELEKRKIKTKTGLDKWNSKAILKLLKNEKYTGDLLLGRYCTINNLENKSTIINNGESNRYLIRNHHKAIISKEDFKKAQTIMKEKHAMCLTRDNHAHNRYCFSNRMICGFCGNTMKRNNMESNPYYRCSLNRDRINPDCNKSRSLKEIVLKEAWLTICKNFSKSKYSTDNNLVRDKIRLFRKNLYQNKFNEFDEKIFSKLVHSVIFGNIIDGVDKVFSIRFILRTNNIIDDYPKLEEVKDNYHILYCEELDIKTNWRDHSTNKLYYVDKIYVSLEIDMDGYF